MLLAVGVLCRLFRDTRGDQVDGTCRAGSSSTTGASCSSHRLGRGVRLRDLRLPCDCPLRDGPGGACSSSSSSTESHIEVAVVGLRLLVIEFKIKSRIRRGDGSSLKAAFWGVRLAFSANSSGFLMRVIGTRR